MSIKLDDLLNEKKGPAPVLDLCHASLASRSDFDAVLAKVPEYKVRPEKVDIDWRMLTTARPKSKLEEEVFSRYVEMGRLQLARQKLEEGKEQTWRTVKVVPGRGAVVEVRLAVCEQCGDELCAARCTDHLYTSYQRQDQVQSVHQLPAPGPGTVCTPATSARTRYSLYTSYQRQDQQQSENKEKEGRGEGGSAADDDDDTEKKMKRKTKRRKKKKKTAKIDAAELDE
ncbi:uncharacterized protein LOC108668044 [Hyalella azteca]|uniref:Uncharacterized protein LOC108668044 n=1 Tax=Hyalella azteca TaxID=294128 RepID=A0A8B7NAP9_HYAAZ|nr:uncharacterized protein LOC108668044 [Hyalella azteca]